MPISCTACAAATAVWQRGRVGQPDVLAGEDHQPPGDEPRVLPRLDHPRQVVQRRVGVGAADRLDEGADDVVVLVALAVVAHRRLVDRGLGRLQVDRRLPTGARRPRRPPPGRSATGGRRRRPAVRGARGRPRRASYRAAEPPLVDQRAARITSRTSSSVSGCSRSSRLRDSSGEITEKNGFSVVAATSVTQRFSTPGSSASCCALLKRCTSSTNSTVSLAAAGQLARGPRRSRRGPP